jgi:hypothetical protein
MAKNKPKIEEEIKHRAIKTYKLGNVRVRVAIDFENNKISLLEEDSEHIKKWVFAERGIEYIQAWRDILEAMQYAIDRASGELNVEIKRRQLQEELESF